MKSLLFLFFITMVTLGSCNAQKSNKEKLIGKWAFAEGWSVESGGVYPKRSDSSYEMANDMLRKIIKDRYFFYDGNNAGTIKGSNETTRQSPLTFINDSTYKLDYSTAVIHFEGNNTLIEFNPDNKEYTKLKRAN